MMMRPFHREGEGTLNESPSEKEGKSFSSARPSFTP